MQTFACDCGNRLFYENVECVACGSKVGWCPQCRRITALQPYRGNALRCGNPDCGVELIPCRNYSVDLICNRCVAADDEQTSPAERTTPALCSSCRLTEVIPDLSVPGNREKWYRLETAKRRLLYQLDQLGLPYESEDVDPPLSFDFKANVDTDCQDWRSLEDGRVYTGHANGKITIDIAEADDAERERLRVQFGEYHRTLIGHFRHEIGHYYWQILVQDRREAEFQKLFGDHRQPSYGEAKQHYYKTGPAPDWSSQYVSAYASMHPWEDFAETFAVYLEITSVLATAAHLKVVPHSDPKLESLDVLIARYQTIGLVVNELNRSLGLLDLVPRAIVAAVRLKLQFIQETLLAADTLRAEASSAFKGA